MIANLTFSSNEKKLFFIVGIVMGLMALDAGGRWYQGMWVQSSAQKAELKKTWEYSSAILSRAATIEAQYSDVRSKYLKLFENTNDSAEGMADLDKAAKNAGLEVDMIKPFQRDGEVSNRYEISLKGSWTQVMKFLQQAESPANSFSFPIVRIYRLEPSGELLVSAEAERISL